MESPKPIPEAISHRQLAQLLRTAATEAARAEVIDGHEPGVDHSSEAEALLQAYGQLSVRLLKAFEGSGEVMAQGRTPRQLMAMGALRAHAQMALQALAASRA
ncbi:MAG: hypothetical protein AAFX65_07980 [Cyanobacteria bacterium J06638_7]